MLRLVKMLLTTAYQELGILASFCYVIYVFLPTTFILLLSAGSGLITCFIVLEDSLADSDRRQLQSMNSLISELPDVAYCYGNGSFPL